MNIPARTPQQLPLPLRHMVSHEIRKKKGASILQQNTHQVGETLKPNRQ